MAWIILECVSLNPRSTLAGSLASGAVLEARGNFKLIHGKHNRESIDDGPSGWATSPRDQLVPQDHVIREEHRAWPLWPSCFLLPHSSSIRLASLTHFSVACYPLREALTRNQHQLRAWISENWVKGQRAWDTCLFWTAEVESHC